MRASLFLLLVAVLFVFVPGCDSRDQAKSTGSIQEIPLEPYRTELLEIAFRAASAMPVNPHIKDRSRIQESVVQACLKLEQPSLALGYIEHVENWRRGAVYADLALYYVQHGAMKEKVEPLLNKADEVAAKAEDWRRDRIRVKIAQVHTLLGQHQQAQVYAAGVVESESGKLAQAEVLTLSADSFDEEIEALDKIVLTGHFDAVKNTLEAFTELYNRFYTDAEQRQLIEEKIKAAWGGLPVFVRIDLLIKLAEFSLENSDQAKAVEHVNEAKSFMDSGNWQLRLAIPMRARLAELHYRCGQGQSARSELRNVLALFDSEREKVVNIYRAGILRSVAEAYWALNDTDTALGLYKRAIEAGIENPNSRPRAEGLATTCCSMALKGVEPDADFFSRIRKIRDNLRDPW